MITCLPSPAPYMPQSTTASFHAGASFGGWGATLLNKMAGKLDENGWLYFDSPARPSPNAFRTLTLKHGVALVPFVKKSRSNYSPNMVPFLLALEEKGKIKPYFWPLTVQTTNIDRALEQLWSLDLSWIDQPKIALTPEDAQNNAPVSPSLPLDLSDELVETFKRGLLQSLLLAAREAFDMPIESVKIRSRTFHGSLDTLSTSFVTLGPEQLYHKKLSKAHKAQWAIAQILDEYFPKDPRWIATTYSDKTYSQFGSISSKTLYKEHYQPAQSAHEILQASVLAEKMKNLDFPDKYLT